MRMAGTALVENPAFQEMRGASRSQRLILGGAIRDVLEKGNRCAGLAADDLSIETNCFILIRGNLQIALRICKELIHFYSILIIYEPNSDPDSPVALLTSCTSSSNVDIDMIERVVLHFCGRLITDFLPNRDGLLFTSLDEHEFFACSCRDTLEDIRLRCPSREMIYNLVQPVKSSEYHLETVKAAYVSIEDNGVLSRLIALICSPDAVGDGKSESLDVSDGIDTILRTSFVRVDYNVSIQDAVGISNWTRH